jgi:transposase
VETRIACQQDAKATEDIHQSLAAKNLLPQQYIVDTAYVSGPQLVSSQNNYGIDLLGPVLPDTS